MNISIVLPWNFSLSIFIKQLLGLSPSNVSIFNLAG